MATMPSVAEVDTPNALGRYLAKVRQVKDWSLRAVEEATNKEVSNAYLSQLENGKITKPSPHILHSLSQVYGVPYEELMELAGYIAATSERVGTVMHGRAATFASANLTEEEETALLAYLRLLREQKK